jgi:hypothetical protein
MSPRFAAAVVRYIQNISAKGVLADFRSDAIIEDCEFSNLSRAVAARSQSDVVVRENRFSNARVHSHRSGSFMLLGNEFSGALGHPFLTTTNDAQGSLHVRNNTFADNANGGVRVTAATTSLAIENNVFYQVGTAVQLVTSEATIACNVLWENAVNWAGIADQTGLNGNVVADPLFCDAANHVFTVAKGSPCLPENSNGCGLIGAHGLGCGAVTVESMTWGGIKGLYR